MVPDIDEQTLRALDWAAILEALSEGARTSRGRQAARALGLVRDLDAVHRAHDGVEEIRRLEAEGGWVPVGGIEDVAEPLGLAAKGSVLDAPTLRTIGRTLDALDRLGGYLLNAEEEIPTLRALADGLRQDRGVTDLLLDAFDETGALSARMWPELGELRQRIQDLHGSVRRTLEELVKGDELADVLQDRFVTQRGDRYVLPVKANFKRKEMGIVHGMSGSGQTAFVEPHQVVALNNELRMAEGALEAAERRILADLSTRVGRVAPAALAALDTAVEVDLACARAALAERLDAVRPIVRDQGVLHLVAGRHPVLALRDVEVVPNDLDLSGEQPILVVSGPNTGGKTIALKTVGLAALLVRLGCFVPAAEGSRVDLFRDVVAVIGDHQTVHGDHSSFSSHLAVLQEMTRRAAPSGLYLVDEIASGTDPAQGAALALAILERWLSRGPRAVITTHFHRLKTIGATDPRFAIAGMQFAHGRPTYRLLTGASGESHALEIARRMGVETELVDRARALMDEGERDLADALAALDRERSRAEDASERAEALATELDARTKAVAAREEKLTEKARELERKKAEAFLERLSRAEDAVRKVVADLQAAPSHARVDAAKATLTALKGIAEQATTRDEPAEEPAEPAALAEGDRVRLRSANEVGEVVSLGRKVQVRTSRGLVVRVKPTDLVKLAPEPAAKPAVPRVPPKKAPRIEAPPLDQAVRHDANTCDLRGKRVDEGLEALEQFMDRSILDGQSVVFVLHGHGTGAMKEGVRRWLRTAPGVARWTPAHAEQGGDAYTVVALR